MNDDLQWALGLAITIAVAAALVFLFYGDPDVFDALREAAMAGLKR